MSNQKLELADIFRSHGDAWRRANAGHVGLGQLKAMSAIQNCRTAALGGHVESCEDCHHSRISYNSCRNRHCPKCQWTAAERWLEARKAELLPVPYFHVVFTLPAQINAIAYQNKKQVYDILFKAAAETLCTIAADPKHLGAKIGVTSVLHSWGQNLQYHPHVHCIVPSGGISADGTSWVSCKPGFFLPVRVLSRLFRRLFLQHLAKAFAAEQLNFFNDLSYLSQKDDFERYLEPLRKKEWVVYAKRPFAGSEQVLAYLARYTHRVAIANSRLIGMKDSYVDFKWKDYRLKGNNQHKIMRLPAHDFISRFLLHVLPNRFHRIRHHGLFANGHRAQKVELCRKLLLASGVENPPEKTEDGEKKKAEDEPQTCPCCGGKMLVIMSFEHQYSYPKYHANPERFDGL